MRYNRNKAVSVVLYILNKSSLQKNQLINILYWADKQHLLEWGRTITGDNWRILTAGKHTIVYPISISWGILHQTFFNVSDCIAVQDNKYIPLCKSDLSELSISDTQALDYAFEHCKDKSVMEDTVCIKKIKAGKVFIELVDWAEGDSALLEHIKEMEANERFLR